MYTDSDRLREGVVIVVAGVAVMSYRKINIGSCQVMSGRQEIVSSPYRAQCSMWRSVELGMVPDIQRCRHIHLHGKKREMYRLVLVLGGGGSARLSDSCRGEDSRENSSIAR